jgi:hypothetical protein
VVVLASSLSSPLFLVEVEERGRVLVLLRLLFWMTVRVTVRRTVSVSCRAAIAAATSLLRGAMTGWNAG